MVLRATADGNGNRESDDQLRPAVRQVWLQPAHARAGRRLPGVRASGSRFRPIDESSTHAVVHSFIASSVVAVDLVRLCPGFDSRRGPAWLSLLPPTGSGGLGLGVFLDGESVELRYPTQPRIARTLRISDRFIL